MKVKISDAKKSSEKVLQIYGYDKEEAKSITEVIIWAELGGSSQGLNKLFGWRLKKDGNASKPKIMNKSPNIISIDGMRNNSMYICNSTVKLLIPKARKYGIAALTVNNVNNSSGAIGYYTSKLAENGLVGIMFSSADPGVVPYGSNEPILGTNPLSVAIPSRENKTLLLDMSTADLTWGDLVKADIEGSSLPENVAFDKVGNSTRNPKEAMDGSVVTFGNTYKSFGLSLMIQILAGPLVGSIYDKDYSKCDYGHLIIAIDPKITNGDLRHFEKYIDEIILSVKSARMVKGVKEIYYPGERSGKLRERNLKRGWFEVDNNLWEEIQAII